jgi:hypothetical protein
MVESAEGDFEITNIYQFQLPTPAKNSKGPYVAVERSEYDAGAQTDGKDRKKSRAAARDAAMQRNFDKLIDEGMLLLEGEEADKRYVEIWEKVKRMQKL